MKNNPVDSLNSEGTEAKPILSAASTEEAKRAEFKPGWPPAWNTKTARLAFYQCIGQVFMALLMLAAALALIDLLVVMLTRLRVYEWIVNKI